MIKLTKALKLFQKKGFNFRLWNDPNLSMYYIKVWVTKPGKKSRINAYGYGPTITAAFSMLLKNFEEARETHDK